MFGINDAGEFVKIDYETEPYTTKCSGNKIVRICKNKNRNMWKIEFTNGDVWFMQKWHSIKSNKD